MNKIEFIKNNVNKSKMYRRILNKVSARPFHANFKDKLICQNPKIGLFSDPEKTNKLIDDYEKLLATAKRALESMKAKDYYQRSTIEILQLRINRLNRKIDTKK